MIIKDSKVSIYRVSLIDLVNNFYMNMFPDKLYYKKTWYVRFSRSKRVYSMRGSADKAKIGLPDSWLN